MYYSQATAQTVRTRSTAYPARKRSSGARQRAQAPVKQLLVCLLLFLSVYVGKGVFPQRLEQVGGDIMSLISDDTDFRGAFLRLGQSLAAQGSVLGEIGSFCVEVLGGVTELPSVETDLLAQEQKFLSTAPSGAALAAHYLRLQDVPEEWLAPSVDAQPAQAEETVPQQPEQTVQEVPVLPAIQPAGTVLRTLDYSGPELPKGYTLDELSLGDLQVATPVFGPLHSEYGYREHPLSGGYKFHNGVDIGAYNGDPIKAFAAGTVEYTGQSDVYGLYFRIDHGNGVKSFYAHCSRLLVQKGQQVAAGEKVAEVGATGTATGPHLHLELSYDGTHIDPAYYIDYKKS